MEMLERIKGGKMIILEIMLIPLLALALVAMVFLLGMAGLEDSAYPSGQGFSDETETGADFPIIGIGYDSSPISLPASDPAVFMIYQVENQYQAE
jgi:hypothetical protein